MRDADVLLLCANRQVERALRTLHLDAVLRHSDPVMAY
jgi:hypothetical protein